MELSYDCSHHIEGSCRQNFKSKGIQLCISILEKLMAEQGFLEVTTRQLDLYINTATVTISVLQFSSLSHLFTKKLFLKLTFEFAETQRMAHWI